MSEQTNEMREAAHKYCDSGFSIFPIGGNKKPLMSWKKYQSVRATHEEIDTWFTQYPDMSIGIATGAISGFVAIDVEKKGDMSLYPTTVTVETGSGGYHLYYKCPGEDVRNSTKFTFETDIRGDGGYVVAPPSFMDGFVDHPDADKRHFQPYKWVKSPWDTEMAEYPADLIESLRAQKKQKEPRQTATASLERVPVGQRNDAATRFIGAVFNALPVKLWQTAGWGALKEWNATLTEAPLEERELRSVFESIKGRAAASRDDSDDEEDVALTPFTLAELFQEEFPPVLWLAENLIPLGGVTALTGDSNTYKSFLTIALAMSVAQGQPFLGNFATPKGKVLLVDEENHRRYIRKRFEEMGMESTEDILFLSHSGIKLDKGNYAMALKDVLDRERPALVVLDSLVRFHSKEENSATEMSKVMSEIRKLTADDRAVVVIHHHKKEQGFQRKSGGQSVRGSSDIFASLDCHISVERKEDHLILSQNKLRVQHQLEPFKVMRILKENGGIAFDYDGTDTTRQDRILEVAEEIKALLGTASEALPLKTIHEEIDDASKSVIKEAIKTMLASEVITASRRARGAYFYELAPVDEDEETEEEVASDDEKF